MSTLKLVKRKKPHGTSEKRRVARLRRHARVLKKIRGTGARPRLVVFRSLKQMEAQLMDDERGIAITGVSTRNDDVTAKLGDERHKSAQSHAAGVVMAERALAKGIDSVVFDRGGYQYHGRVKAFADGARKGGLKF